MKQIDVKELRRHLKDFYNEAWPENDEEFLQIDLYEIGFDSLDCADMFATLFSADFDEMMFEKSDFYNKRTVENLMKLFNDYALSH